MSLYAASASSSKGSPFHAFAMAMAISAQRSSFIRAVALQEPLHGVAPALLRLFAHALLAARRRLAGDVLLEDLRAVDDADGRRVVAPPLRGQRPADDVRVFLEAEIGVGDHPAVDALGRFGRLSR